MKIGTVTDQKEEIAKKKEYNPPAEIKSYADEQMAEWSWDFQSFQKQYRPFNGRSFIDYMTIAQDDTFKYVPEPKDPNDWRNFVRSGEERNKLDSLLAFLLDLNFRCEPVARDWLGSINDEMGEFAEAYLRYINIIDQTDEKDPWSDLAMFSTGTLFKQVKFTNRQGIRKIGADWNPFTKSITDFKYDMRVTDEFEGVESTIWKPNRVFLSDVSQPMYELQDHIWYEVVVSYAIAYKTFSEWDQWKFVMPYNPSYDQWTDTDVDTETEDNTLNDKVRIRFRESTVTNELSIYCNKVLMTPPGLPLPGNRYSLFYQQAAMLHPQFAYGRSFMDNVRPFVAVKDVLTSILVDKSRQILEPPLKSRFRTMVNRYMFKPANVTPMQGEGDLTPLIPESAMTSFVFEAIKIYDSMADKASVSPVFQGQQQKGQMTKFEVEQMLMQSIRSVAGMVGSSVAWRKKEAKLKFQVGIEHLSQITGMQFEVNGDMKGTSRNYKMESIPKNKQKYVKMLKTLLEQEGLLKSQGKRSQFFIIDPAVVKDYGFVFDYRVNPQQRDSQAADEQSVREKIAAYRQAPNINQRAVDKLLIKMNNDDEEELLNPEQQPMQQGLPGQNQPQPQMQGVPKGMGVQPPNPLETQTEPQMQPQF